MKNRYISILGLVVPLTMTVQDAPAMDMLSSGGREIIEKIRHELNEEDLKSVENYELINIKEITDKIISSDSHKVAIGLNELLEAIPTLTEYEIISEDEAKELAYELYNNKDIQKIIGRYAQIIEETAIRTIPRDMRKYITNQGEMLFDDESNIEIIWDSEKARERHNLGHARIKIKEEPIEFDRLREIIHREGIKLTGADEITDEMAGYIANKMKNEIPTRKRLREIIEQIQHTPLNSKTEESAMIIRYLIERANEDPKLIPQLENADAVINRVISAKANIAMIMDKYKIQIDKKNAVDTKKKEETENEIKANLHKEEGEAQRHADMQIEQ